MVTIAYVPTLLRTMEEICRTFGVSPSTVRSWLKEGAPIVSEGEGVKTRYSAELTRLQLWRENKSKDKASDASEAQY